MDGAVLQVAKMMSGVEIDGVHVAPQEVGTLEDSSRLRVVVADGKKHEVGLLGWLFVVEGGAGRKAGCGVCWSVWWGGWQRKGSRMWGLLGCGDDIGKGT